MSTTADLIKALAPILEPHRGTPEVNQIEMSLIWGIEPEHAGGIWDMITHYEYKLYTELGLINAIYRYLKTRNYF